MRLGTGNPKGTTSALGNCGDASCPLEPTGFFRHGGRFVCRLLVFFYVMEIELES